METKRSFVNSLSALRAEAMPLSRLILVEVRSGRLRIPEFQRELRWKSADNVKLIDSILRGYPIGSILLWQRPGTEQDVSRLGAVRIPAKARADAWFVVDGQQRLTALAGAMLPLEGQSPHVQVYVDVRDLSLRSGDDPQLDQGQAIALSTLVDTAAFRAWSRRSDVDDDTLAELDTLAARIREYTVPLYFVDAGEEDTLREVFTRMNATGARMTAPEVFAALPRGDQAGRERARLETLHRICASSGFGDPDDAELLKIVMGVAGLDPSRRPERLAKQDLNKLPDQSTAEEALQRTLSFLIEDAGIPHLRLLPYPVVLSILARFFHVHPNPDPVNRANLAVWLWRGAFTGAHQRAAVSKMREAIRDILPDDEHGTLRALLHGLPSAQEARWMPERYHAKNAKSRVETLALWSKGPRLLPQSLGATESVSGGTLTLIGLLESQRLSTEVFRTSEWASWSAEGRRLGSTVANRVLQHDRHTGLAGLLRRLDPDEHRDVLASHVISADAFAALRRGEDEAFLQLRHHDIARAVERFLAERCQWDRPILPPLHSYFLPASADVHA